MVLTELIAATWEHNAKKKVKWAKGNQLKGKVTQITMEKFYYYYYYYYCVVVVVIYLKSLFY